MVTRAASKAATRARILDAARDRFDEDGFESATIRAIAADAEVAVGSVHAHFGDKGALLRACLHDDLERAIEQVWETLDEDAPLATQLVHCARGLYQSYARRPALSRVMLSQTLFPGTQDPPDTLLEPFLERVVSLIARAGARGEIALDREQAVTAARAFFALYLATLIGGLGGAFGDAPSAGLRADLWAAQLEPGVRFLLEGRS